MVLSKFHSGSLVDQGACQKDQSVNLTKALERASNHKIACSVASIAEDPSASPKKKKTKQVSTMRLIERKHRQLRVINSQFYLCCVWSIISSIYCLYILLRKLQ